MTNTRTNCSKHSGRRRSIAIMWSKVEPNLLIHMHDIYDSNAWQIYQFHTFSQIEKYYETRMLKDVAV